MNLLVSIARVLRSDPKEWGWRTTWWNVRWLIAYALLGYPRHMSAYNECDVEPEAD